MRWDKSFQTQVRTLYGNEVQNLSYHDGDENIVAVSIIWSFVPDTNAVDAIWTVARNPGRSEIMAGCFMFLQRSI